MMHSDELRTAIKVESIKAGLHGKEVAAKMGIHPIHYYKVVNGMAPISDGFLSSVTKIFPALKDVVSKVKQNGNGEGK